MDEQPTPTRGLSLPPIIRQIAGGILLLTLAAWIAQALACYHELWAYCGGSAYVTLAGLVSLGILGRLGLIYRERALRRASRGMYARGWSRGAGHELAATFSKVTRFIIEGEPDPVPGLITGARRFERRGWWVTVPIGNGRAVWVDRWQLWQWLIEVEGLRYQLDPGESEIGQRYWEPRIGRGRWMAYMIILEAAGAAETVTGDPRSRRYVGGDAWGWVEEYERVRGSAESRLFG